MDNLNLDELNTILVANNYTRICANTWLYRADFCNVYLDIIKEECVLLFQSTGTSHLSINFSKTLKVFDKNTLGSRIATICDMLSLVSSRATMEIKNILVGLE